MVMPVDEPEDEQPAKTLDADDIRFLKTYGLGPYAAAINQTATDIKDIQKRVVETIGIKESDTGLAPPSRWDLVADKQMLYEEQPLQVRAS
jgi:26S proteasome regulatory subunit T1